jgi:UDP-2-acetamido-3-amino-2,3-dideoxy-glucuronate N-acetyltransferase
MMHTDEIPAIASSFFAHPMALVDTTEIGQRTRVWAFAHIMQGARVGSDCNIGEHVFIEDGSSLGNHVTVKNGVSIWKRVTVEDHCFLGPHCVFTNDKNPRAYLKKGPEALLPTRVNANATIGANATIVCGTTIGCFAFVGAGSVVIRDVQEYALVAGNPARQIGWMCACAAKLPLKVSAAMGESCRCVQCGAVFVRASSGLARTH